MSLEIQGVFEAMGLDPALLHRVEVDGLLAQHAALAGPAGDARTASSSHRL